MEVDDIMQLLGGYKPFQLVAYLCLGLLYMRGSWHVFSPMYLGFDPGHHCTPAANTSLNLSIPWKEEDGVWGWDKCKMFATPGEGNATVACQNGWTYSFLPGETSFLAEWNLVCDKEYLVELSTTIYMVGTTCGALFLSPLSDVFGRKTVMLACLWAQAVLGFGLAWVTDLITYTVVRFFIGLLNMTIALCVSVLLNETFASTHRLLPAVSVQFFWAMGIMLLALFGYLVRNWRHLEMLISLPNLLSIGCIWLLSESVPWLVSKKKVDEAESVLHRAAKMNKIALPIDIRRKLEDVAQGTSSTAEGSVGVREHGLDREWSTTKPELEKSEGLVMPEATESYLAAFGLLCIPKINIYCFIMFFLFLANSLGYFGVLFLTPTLDGDRFLNLFLSALVEIPAYIIAYASNRCIGRRIPMSVFLLVCAVSNIGAIFVPSTAADGSDISWLKTTLVMIGKFGITGSYSTVYLYASEMFPTSVRNHALGMCSFFENIGSMAAPFMVLAAKTKTYLPLSIFGGLTAAGGLLVLGLPETHKRPLPQTVKEVQSWGRGRGYLRSMTGSVNHAFDTKN
ncbi:organic cation transporter protein-like [Haliotis rubra]|uniref:organic cation transporter protein-like n=1 Tax=Haliotis rubra TaxID=36100 RepID=UPI001EE5A4A6|nr:organic cation transporter protein-like [Haliotis rubra]